VAALLYTARLYRLPELQTMATSPTASQTRLPLTRPLSEHDQRPASTLVARQFTSSLTASQVFPEGKDSALVDATAGAVNVTLPPGSDKIIGLPFYARKTDVSANAVGLVRAGSDTFAPGAGTSITTTVQGAEIGATWDGTNRRAMTGAASGGAVAATTVTASGAISAGTTLAIGTGATIGGTGTGTAAANLTLNKTAGGVGGVVLQEAGAIRAKAGLDASENYVIEVFTGAAGAEASQGSITISPTGAVTLTDGLTVSSGGVTVTAGGLTITAGSLILNLAGVGDYADDAAAAIGGVAVGQPYRTASALKIRAA
jgi:hypothetical protein